MTISEIIDMVNEITRNIDDQNHVPIDERNDLVSRVEEILDTLENWQDIYGDDENDIVDEDDE